MGGFKPGGGGRYFGGGVATGHSPRPFSHEKRVGAPMSFQNHMGEEPGRMARGGVVNDGYEGEEGEAAYRGHEEDHEEEFSSGGMACPRCGYKMSHGGRVGPRGPVDEEEGSEKYAAHGEPDPSEPQESFGRALMKKYGHRGV